MDDFAEPFFKRYYLNINYLAMVIQFMSTPKTIVGLLSGAEIRAELLSEELSKI